MSNKKILNKVEFQGHGRFLLNRHFLCYYDSVRLSLQA